MAKARYAFPGASVLVLALLGGCAARDALAPGPTAAAFTGRAPSAAHPRVSTRDASGGKIQHVVYIIQENRSFNYMFLGFPGATTQDYGYDQNGNKIKLHKQTIATAWDIDHSADAFFAAYDNGKLDGWNSEYACCGGIPKNFAYAYAPKKETATYWQMAAQYVLADQFFQSNLDGSFIAHQYSIAAYANHEVDYPTSWWGCEGGATDTVPTLNPDRSYGPDVPVCEDYPTLGDELDAAGVSWRSYSYPYNLDGGLWNAYAAVDHIYEGPDFKTDVITPADQFIADVAGGKLAGVTWITATFENSDHAGFKSKTGPRWVASLVNAVGQSQFWDSSAVFIIWDDWGGWYDPVAPIYMDYDGLGFRIPMIAISPYAKKGYVTHVQYESSSILKFMEDTFGVSALAASDARAADPANDVFDFSQAPRTFAPFIVDTLRPAARWSGTRPPVGGD